MLAEYSEGKDPTYNMVVYMPLGVLSFLLDTEELEWLANNTDDKFWAGVKGWYNYRVEFTKLHGYDYVTLKSRAEKDNNVLSFNEE